MARVSFHPLTRDATDDRGQLVVITGLVIAVVLVGLVILVNTAIYTENLATRDPDIGDGEAIEYADTVRTGIGGLIDRENADEYDEYSHVTANVTVGVETLDTTLQRTYVERGVDATLNESGITYDEGRLVRQTDENRQFESATGISDEWDVAHDVNGTRAFTATVDDASLNETTDENLGDAFHVAVEENATGNMTWEAYVYENESTNEIAVAIGTNDTEPTERCSVAAATATVDFTAGTLDGADCPGFEWADGNPPDGYDIVYRNGNRATGTYNMTVSIVQGSVNAAQLNDEPGNGSPYHVPAVYGAQVDVTYRTPDLLFRTELWIAPGEPDA